MTQAFRSLILGLLLVSGAAVAQNAPVAIDIPAQPLSEALKQLGRQTNLQIFFAPELVAGKAAPAVRGQMAPVDALGSLLKGSGVEYVQSGSAVTLRRSTATQGEQQMPEVKVQASNDPNALPQPYAGGQVARGGQMGVLGNRDVMDLPFNQSNYTSQLIQNQDVRHVADVLENDPTARATSSASTSADDFIIRGFPVSNIDMLLNGMPAVVPSFFNSMMTESLERIEVLKGPNSLLNGYAAGGSIGGTINLVPKRAGSAPLTQFNATYSEKSLLGGHLDLGRRFGEGRELGVRLNAVHRDGDTSIDYQSRTSTLFAAGVDYQGERFRLSFDGGYQEQDFKGARDFPMVAAGVQTPRAPDATSNYQGTAGFSNPKVFYGALRGEFDIDRSWTVFAGAGGNERKTQYLFTGRTIINEQGDLAAFSGNSAAADRMNALALEAGTRGRFETGPVKHELVLAYNQLTRDWYRIRQAYAAPASNIYNPTFGPDVDRSTLPDPDNLNIFQVFESSSLVLADTLSSRDGRIQVTVGARRQKLYSNFVPFAGAEYGDDAVTPMLAAVYKIRPNISLYGNYIEALKEGAIAPLGTANEGQGFAPFKAKQYEGGVKFDFGRFTTTVALYQIVDQSGFTDTATNIFAADGEQTHRGIDFNFFGEVAKGVRLLGGVNLLDSEMTKTQDGLFDGKQGVGVPESRLVLGAEWDTPFVERFTLTGRVVRNSSLYLDAANTQSIPGWTRLDLGARYRINKTVMVRANLTNATNEAYWDANTFGQLTLSDPRTLSVSASFDF